MLLGSLLRFFFGTSRDREIKRLKPLLDAVNAQEARCAGMSNAALRAETGRLKARIAAGESLDDVLPEAFAAIREASKRVTSMRPFDVQILGGIVLHHGDIAEMVTGEGKTLVATMPLYLNALSGRGVHLVTVNDYLARRDSQWMGPIFEFLGLTVGLIQHDMNGPERQAAYRADIMYATNNELGFDYLRDNMAHRREERVQRELNYAIVDEVDSILVDEARTPLIISGRPEKSSDTYFKVDAMVRQLKKGVHYEAEEKGHHILLTEDGMEHAERLLGLESLYTDESLGIVHMMEQALKAHNFYKKDDEYVVRDGDVLIVDEFTGRIMDGRRYSDGLHQALEAKEQVPVQFESQTVASITYQNFFKLYGKLAGMTGTAATEAVELAQIYNLNVIQVPTNLPMDRADQTDLIFATEKGKFRYVVGEIERIRATGRPILVGTVSIEKSEYVASLLDERGIEGYQVLNAKHHEREASIVAAAGKPGAITIATNMAGRGTDIKLAEGVRETGGLAIIGTERHESRRIDNQLRGRAGRQGDPGSTRFYVSLEDEVARLFGGDKVKKMISYLGGEQMDEEPLDQRMVTRTIERSQRQVEEYNFEIRKHLFEYDIVMNRQRLVIYKLRNDVLENKDITDQLVEMFEQLVGEAVDEYAPAKVASDEWDLEGLGTRLRMLFGFTPNLHVEEGGGADLESEIVDQVRAEYARREALIADELREAFRIEVGGDDSKVDFARLARQRVHEIELMAMLHTVDDKWIDHLKSMDYLRESVRIRAFGQKDPLLEYKQEGFEMFEAMLQGIYETVTQTVFRLTDPELRRNRETRVARPATAAPAAAARQAAPAFSYASADKEQDRSFASFDASKFALAGQKGQAGRSDGDGKGAHQAGPSQEASKPKTIKRVGEKQQPNDPCPCGSGKKYKKCHGAAV